MAQAIRRQVIKHAPKPFPAFITGHEDDGAPLRSPHIGYVPLGHIGYEHSDGTIKGVGITLPSCLNEEERQVVRQTLGAISFIDIGGSRVGVTPSHDDRRFSLSTERYTCLAGSQEWSTVTPISLPRITKSHDEILEMLAMACHHAGLPTPTMIGRLKQSIFTGVPWAGAYLPYARGWKRYHVHAIFQFPEKVRGPLIIGSGRYFGMGLLAPTAGE
jgi:CRISPR-associated protein Csb2